VEIVTPQQVISELNRLQTLSEKGVQTLADAELKLAEAENAFEKAQNMSDDTTNAQPKASATPAQLENSA